MWVTEQSWTSISLSIKWEEWRQLSPSKRSTVGNTLRRWPCGTNARCWQLWSATNHHPPESLPQQHPRPSQLPLPTIPHKVGLKLGVPHPTVLVPRWLCLAFAAGSPSPSIPKVLGAIQCFPASMSLLCMGCSSPLLRSKAQPSSQSHLKGTLSLEDVSIVPSLLFPAAIRSTVLDCELPDDSTQ
jgi:hypothetical protein